MSEEYRVGESHSEIKRSEFNGEGKVSGQK